ncbi:MAG: L-threonylcarbamoyladenylate synthase [Acidiferrobacterales bacterium]
MSNSWHINQAARVIHRGGIVAYPTEAIFGLGCDPFDLAAVWRLILLKQRSVDKGLVIIASDMEQLLPFIKTLDGKTENKVMATWPGPVTWLLPAQPWVSPLLRGRHETIAVRITAHPIAARLCHNLGHSLVSTSANIAEQRPARNTFEVQRRFGDAIDYVLPGRTGEQPQPSEIRDALTDKIIRT